MPDPQETVSTPPVSHELTGNTVGRFSVTGRIGAGGMGQVYRAEDTVLKRVVAIKRMAPQLQFEERDRERFLKEAQRASALNHPNIAAIYDVLREKGETLLVMESPPPPMARPCSGTSQVLQVCPTSQARSSSAYVLRLPDASQGNSRSG